ncbi:MAG: methyltransferase domain-containing protein, partial [Anaerolineae bacterium]|nr:methyltransferase domain-containing protein [Anaerolineae bacterium]
MANKVNQVNDWQKFWEVMGQNKDPIAATDRPTVSPETYRAYCREIEQKLELKPDDILLDIGCGTGLMDAYLSSCVKKVFATDYAFNMAKATGATTARFDNTFALNCAAKPAPFPDQAFSKVLLYAVTQYLSPPEFLNILGELKR